MDDSFDAYEYAGYVRGNWRFIAIACAAAVALAAGISLLVQKKYTATARIVIEPPAGSDQRTVVGVSPIYLESLRTYEHFASSDSLFLRAVERFGLRAEASRRPIESWKKRVLRVEIPRSTKILEISATLPDPGKAQAFALFLAQETVKLNRSVNAGADREIVAAAETQFAEARRRVERAAAAWKQAVAGETVEMLSEDLNARTELRFELVRDLAAAEMLIAEDIEREKAAGPAEGDNIRNELRVTAVRASALKTRVAAMDCEIAREQAALAARTAHADALSAERKNAEAASAAAETRWREVRSAAGYRGEQLEIIDPGITPERPSSPDLPLNAIAAFLLALAGSLVWLTVRFGFVRRPAPVRTTLRLAAGHE